MPGLRELRLAECQQILPLTGNRKPASDRAHWLQPVPGARDGVGSAGTEHPLNHDPKDFEWLYSYSPYQHVKPGTRYPAVLFITGDADTRVAPLHARKMCALLQSATASDRPVLLHYDTKAGHSGGKPLSQVIDDESEELGFLFWQLGMTGAPKP